MQIFNAGDNIELKATLAIDEVSDLLFQSGYRKPLVSLTIEDKEEVLKAMVDYHMMIKVKSAMDDYIEGLKTYNLLDKIRQSPEVWKPLFTKQYQPLSPGIG